MLTIGNAIIDVLAESDDGFLEREGMTKGIMHLIEGERADYLYDLHARRARSRFPAAAPPTRRPASPRSAARAAFVGKVADDDIGRFYTDDLQAVGRQLHHAPGSNTAPAPAAR